MGRLEEAMVLWASEFNIKGFAVLVVDQCETAWLHDNVQCLYVVLALSLGGSEDWHNCPGDTKPDHSLASRPPLPPNSSPRHHHPQPPINTALTLRLPTLSRKPQARPPRPRQPWS